jgi:hypothetical protein
VDSVPEHAYFTFMNERAEPWNPHDPADLPFAGATYIAAYLRELERHWEGDPLTFYVTHHTTTLAGYGPDVVVVLLNDEWYRTPAYSGCVLATLRNLPASPWFPWETLAPPSGESAFAAVNHARVLIERRRADRHAEQVRRSRGWPPTRTDNAIDVPLGYYHQPPRPITPLSERSSDVFFAGSLLHDMQKTGWKRAVKRIAGNPKQVYRQSMLRELEDYRARHPELRAKVSVSGDFRALGGSEVSAYADAMMDSRIALVPRGTVAESYRLFEAWRYGCIAICEQLPPRPFLRGAPAITLRSWRELEPVLDELLSDPDRLKALHEASLAWWRDVCSEEVVGRRVAGQLAALRERIDRPAASRPLSRAVSA